METRTQLFLADRAETGWRLGAAPRFVKLPALMDITAGVTYIMVALIDEPVAFDDPEMTVQNMRSLKQRRGDVCVRPESFACTHGSHVAGL
jgi:hypothetical protein